MQFKNKVLLADVPKPYTPRHIRLLLMSVFSNTGFLSKYYDIGIYVFIRLNAQMLRGMFVQLHITSVASVF